MNNGIRVSRKLGKCMYLSECLFISIKFKYYLHVNLNLFQSNELNWLSMSQLSDDVRSSACPLTCCHSHNTLHHDMAL